LITFKLCKPNYHWVFTRLIKKACPFRRASFPRKLRSIRYGGAISALNLNDKFIRFFQLKPYRPCGMHNCRWYVLVHESKAINEAAFAIPMQFFLCHSLTGMTTLSLLVGTPRILGAYADSLTTFHKVFSNSVKMFSWRHNSWVWSHHQILDGGTTSIGHLQWDFNLTLKKRSGTAAWGWSVLYVLSSSSFAIRLYLF